MFDEQDSSPSILLVRLFFVLYSLLTPVWARFSSVRRVDLVVSLVVAVEFSDETFPWVWLPLELAVVVVKITAPSAMDRYRDRLLDLMAGQTDFRAAFSAVGRAVSGQGAVGKALNDAYTAVFGPQQTVPEGTADPAAYSAETTPGDVCLTQQVLGFAYANPLTGTVTDRFGYRQDPGGSGTRFHYGLDIAADEGAVITAFASGTVTAVGDSAELGNYVTVQHEGGFATLYAHCSRITASSGQQVRPGDPIAEVGRTGNATGPHLHFELHKDGVYVNPIYYYAAP